MNKDNSKDRIAMILFGNEHSYLDMFDQKMVNRVNHAFKEKDEKFYTRLQAYVQSAEFWYEGSGDLKDQQVLIADLPFLKAATPYKEIPKVLYRGLNNLKSRPKEGQSVVYLPNDKNPLTSWTEDPKVAQDFAPHFAKSVVLEVRREDVLSSAVPVLWPGSFISPMAEQESEWTLHIKKPLKIFKWRKTESDWRP